MISGIYRIINIRSEGFYVGSAINLEKRKYSHFYNLRKGKHSNKYLQYSFNLYGEESFIFDILEYCDKENLIGKEQFWINAYKTQGIKLYNICSVAYSRLGCKMSEETKGKMSLAAKGKKKPWALGKKFTEEHKRKISEANKKIPSNRKGIKHTDETKKKMSENSGRYWKGKVIPKEARKKMSLAKKGKPLKEEHKVKLRKPKIKINGAFNY